MKRFTSLMLMLLMAVTTWAQTLVTDASTISDEKVYTLAPSNTSSTGVICVPGTDATMLYMSTHASATQDIDATNINQRFAFLTTENGKTYLYSLGAQKFVADNGEGTTLLSNITSECDVRFLASTGSAKESYPLVVEVGGDYLCISNASHWTQYGYVLTNWNHADDAGCMMAVTAYDPTAEELDLIAAANELLSTVEITIIDAEYNAAKEAAQVVIDRNFASSEKINAINTALANAETAYNSLTITDGVISLADATAFREKIAAISTADKDARYLASTEDLSNNIAFAISTFDRGSWITNGTAITSTVKAGTSADATSPAQQFAFIKSEESGNLYLYSVADAKFVGKNGNGTSLSEKPVQAVTILESTSADFHWVVALVAGESDYNHMGISNGYDPAVITFYNSTADGGNQSRIEPVTTLDEATVNAALAKIAKFEAPKIQEDDVFNWTTTTEWTTVEVADFTSTVMNENNLETISYIEAPITINGPRTAAVTFDYTSGNCALNMRGVEVIDAAGNIVAADYHVGKAGTPPATANVYTVSVVEAGTYNVRCYATFNSQNRANATNGTITVAYEEAQETDFSHNVTFAAEYATLYLGYKVAIPTGVEAYVVSSVDQWATLSPVTDVIPANTAVLLKNTVATETEYTFEYTSENANAVETNYLNGSIVDRYVAEDAYVLANGEVGIGFYIATKNQLENTAFKNNANKAYLVVPGASEVASYSFRFGEGTTGVEKVEIRNEKSEIYDLTGRRVENPSNGIYIINGVKTLVK